ncbi:unnamed protein product [Mytilus coruscus]|uniref:Mab-21-like HhH/H2TH-like domain-containing protein n=1 Tax=Mytilus coruscus TaxID=42192 RepID=A0A6J8AHB5_MYTCO|nr:unnamed protein product [Mytilus coruscus]
MPGSDLDTMFVWRNNEVYEEQPRLNPNISHLSIDTDDVKPGFTQLRLEYSSSQTLLYKFEHFAGKLYLSSTLYTQKFMKNLSENFVTHGPCISDKYGTHDFAEWLHCQVSNFPALMRYFNMEQHRLYVIEVNRTTNSFLLRLVILTFITGFNMDKELLNSSFIRQIFNKILIYILHVNLCSLRAQFISLNSAYSNNKYQYRQYKSCLCTLLQNIHHDAVSGWLMLASLFYKTKQLAKALRIIMYSISKCTFEKMCRNIEMEDIHHQLFKLKSLQKKSIVHLWKLIFVDDMKFKRNSVLIPDELQIDLEFGELFISSSVYAYFLKLLCHYHLINIRQCQDTLQDLQLVLAENN